MNWIRKTANLSPVYAFFRDPVVVIENNHAVYPESGCF